ncbi:MAG: T9SS type A sorting domain-containing protein [Bacteroidetes bacterium]|nr:T9SS type A sorting domain-containing protein [Bacteroidota bacterium]
MKQNYNMPFIVFMMIMATISGPSRGQATRPDNNLYTLYPPLNFAGSMVECSSYLHWQKPQLPGGNTPAGLAGYYLYRDGALCHYISGSDTLNFYDYDIEYGIHAYTITANYDLTTYGVPGQFGESPPAGPISMIQNCDITLPFYELWDAGTFAFQNWRFVPGQGNWSMDVTQGNPLPAVVFTGIPATEDYEVTMMTPSMPGGPWICATMYFEFDYKLADISADGTQKMVVEYFIDNTWFQATELTNQGSTGWIHEKLNISQVIGKRFKVGFKAKGTLSNKISSWAIDNIKISPVCKGPAGCSFTRTGNVVQLSWQHPLCDSLQVVNGYNVYRTSEYGTPPYTKLNTSVITGLSYTDVVTSAIPNGIFRYYVTDLQKAPPPDNTVLCEAAGDTLVVDFSLGIDVQGTPGLLIYLNQATGRVVVKSNSPVESCEIFNILGRTRLTFSPEKRTEFTIPAAGLENGVYMVRIKNANGNFVRKVAVGN